MCRRARYRCDLVDEPGEHFAIVPFPDGDRGLAAILLFRAAGGGTRPPGGPGTNFFCPCPFAGGRGRGGGPLTVVSPFQTLGPPVFFFFFLLPFCCLFS